VTLEGPGELVGENPFALVGGVGAVWIKTTEAEGVIVLRAKHPVLGTETIRIAVVGTTPAAANVVCSGRSDKG
jgi:beta-galactosidase